MARNYRQGKFIPMNPEKYRGDRNNIVYRSSYELKFMDYCDRNRNVIWWQSEETVVPYYSEIDSKWHRYFVDFLIGIKSKDGIKTILIEIKPENQVLKPKVKRMTEKNRDKVETWITNQLKWKAAEDFANQRGWDFKVLTEKELGITR